LQGTAAKQSEGNSFSCLGTKITFPFRGLVNLIVFYTEYLQLTLILPRSTTKTVHKVINKGLKTYV